MGRRKKEAFAMLSLLLSLALAAAPTFGTPPAVDTYEGVYPAANMAWMRLTLPQARDGKPFPIVLTVQPYPKTNLGRVDGTCTRLKSSVFDCKLNDNWRRHLYLRAEKGRMTVSLPDAVLLPEMPNTGGTRSVYDTDFYYHEVSGTFVLNEMRHP